MKSPETEEEVIEFAKAYGIHELILRYLNTKDEKILEEIKKICKDGISQTTQKTNKQKTWEEKKEKKEKTKCQQKK